MSTLDDALVDIELTVNGRRVTGRVEPRTLLVEFLRRHLLLTGTHVGCDTTQCGACTIHLDGKAVKSCTILGVQANGAEVLTIEGIADGEVLHPMQQAFHEHHGLQCGYCTPGMIMLGLDLLKRDPAPTEAVIRANLEGNLCRCTGYHNIVKSIQAASVAMKQAPAGASADGEG